MKYFEDKTNRLYIIMSAFFVSNAMVAEFMGVKIFSVDETLGISKPVFDLFGIHFEGISQTCGVLLWPFVFVMTDIINEYFGVKGVRFISWIAAIMIAYAYLMLYGAMHTAPDLGWTGRSGFEGMNFNDAYLAVFGQGANIIIGSLVAFLIGQLIDVNVFHWIKKRTGNRYVWLRSTGSTLVSQLIDSFVVLFIAFYVLPAPSAKWTLNFVCAVAVVNYIYKCLAAALLTPVIYMVHRIIDTYLGKEKAEEMKAQAIAGTV